MTTFFRREEAMIASSGPLWSVEGNVKILE
jgi:hypothetical protein